MKIVEVFKSRTEEERRELVTAAIINLENDNKRRTELYPAGRIYKNQEIAHEIKVAM